MTVVGILKLRKKEGYTISLGTDIRQIKRMCATDVMDETCVKNAGRKGLWEARVGRGGAQEGRG